MFDVVRPLARGEVLHISKLWPTLDMAGKALGKNTLAYLAHY
jgi:hypothetical protein